MEAVSEVDLEERGKWRLYAVRNSGKSWWILQQIDPDEPNSLEDWASATSIYMNSVREEKKILIDVVLERIESPSDNAHVWLRLGLDLVPNSQAIEPLSVPFDPFDPPPLLQPAHKLDRNVLIDELNKERDRLAVPPKYPYYYGSTLEMQGHEMREMRGRKCGDGILKSR